MSYFAGKMLWKKRETTIEKRAKIYLWMQWMPAGGGHRWVAQASKEN